MGGSEPDFACLEGERVALEHCSALPIDPAAVAGAVGIPVAGDELTGASGMLLRVGDNFAIVYNNSRSNVGFENFCIGHELGHYFLRGHPEKVFDTNGKHRSRAGYLSKEPIEVEADQFAAGLLMPRRLFKAAAAQAGEGLEAIENLARACGASLTATALRYAELAPERVAIVMSDADKVLFCRMSKRFTEYRGLTWLKREAPIPRHSVTAQLVSDPRRIVDRDRLSDIVDIADWFGGGTRVRLVEEVIGLGSYGKVLTILRPDTEPDEEVEEEERDLHESWTPRFRR